MTDRERQTADVIFQMLGQRAEGASVCPSEVARALEPERWRPLMPMVRDVARALASEGKLEIRQRGEPVDPEGELRGPIRLAIPAR